MSAFVVEYRFALEHHHHDVFCLKIDEASLLLLNPRDGSALPWTQLGVHQCPNCPLDPGKDPLCPAAVNMVGLVNSFDQLLSYDETEVTVVTAERKINHKTTVQHAVCSLMGLLMATSNCPLTDFFKPMARFHLPFASTEETIWRATSTYLLAQHFLLQEGRVPDLTFEGLSAMYQEIQIVNQSFAKRLRVAGQYDSMVNGIILLDLFAKSTPTAIDESLENLQYLFEPYLRYINSV